ncbi:helix-turn-helix domain-containing protein [Streptomyces sp. NPDC126933]|uniref:helix-turn-helix transcriptional regulator n=1 Tax=unclassified Streptomyces TaxID=2593676 RepID=UPI00364A23E5
MAGGENIGPMIRRLRQERGWSQSDLARKLNILAGGAPTLDRQHVYRWETGRRTPRDWLPFLAAVFRVDLETLERATAVERTAATASVPTVADFLPEGDPLAPLAVREGRLIGASTVADLNGRVHGLRLADDVVYGRDLIGRALRELRAAVTLYRESTFTDDTGRQLLCAIGELAQVAGWIASDAGQHEDAERIYRLGLSAAHQAGDATLAGNLLGSLAYQTSNVGDPLKAVAMARAAADGAAGAPPRARALYLDRVAWAHTQAGGTDNAQAAMRALGEAGEAITEHTPGTEEPGYLYWVSPGELQVMEARVYTELHRPLRAVPRLRDVLGQYDATHAREVALYLSWLAVALADANEPEEAAATADRMVRMSADMASDRTDGRAAVVLKRLEDFRDVPEVSALLAEFPAA